MLSPFATQICVWCHKIISKTPQVAYSYLKDILNTPKFDLAKQVTICHLRSFGGQLVTIRLSQLENWLVSLNNRLAQGGNATVISFFFNFLRLEVEMADSQTLKVLMYVRS